MDEGVGGPSNPEHRHNNSVKKISMKKLQLDIPSRRFTYVGAATHASGRRRYSSIEAQALPASKTLLWKETYARKAQSPSSEPNTTI